MEQNVSSPVVYVRGSQECELDASFGKTKFEIVDQVGMLQNVESHDFILRSASMLFGDELFIPRDLDEVRVTRGGHVHRYIVTQYGNTLEGNSQVSRWCDPYGTQIRVHTRYEGVIE